MSGKSCQAPYALQTCSNSNETLNAGTFDEEGGFNAPNDLLNNQHLQYPCLKACPFTKHGHAKGPTALSVREGKKKTVNGHATQSTSTKIQTFESVMSDVQHARTAKKKLSLSYIGLTPSEFHTVERCECASHCAPSAPRSAHTMVCAKYSRQKSCQEDTDLYGKHSPT